MSHSDQWYGSVSYIEDTLSDVSAGFSLMERWNTPTTKFELTGTKEVMANLSHILVVAEQAAYDRLGLNCERILVESDKEVPVDMTYETRNVIRARTSRSKSKTRQWTIPSSMQWAGNAGKVMVKVRGRMKGGWLKSTGTVEKVPEINGYRVGYNTPYAHRQHEDLTYRHTRPGAKAKYLEDPAMRIAPTIAADIAEALKGFLL
ncbi:MAG: hypothetical protein M0Q92_02790 [Methanoregula sp.]|nr:hypothetical protein [Methanoregula sp.]